MRSKRSIQPSAAGSSVPSGAAIGVRSADMSWLLGLCGLVEVSPERVEALAPEAAVGFQPSVDLLERLGPHPVEPALGVLAHLYQSGLAQHAQVLGDAGLAEMQTLHELVDRALVVADVVEDATAGGLGQNVEGGRWHGLYIHHRLYACQGIYEISRCADPRPAASGKVVEDLALTRHRRRSPDQYQRVRGGLVSHLDLGAD